ncbi:CRISPR-associated endonuclease Cas2 [Tuanshanicoccus lijuaniae]|uniref:CRISPR-associated endonuclease Cas2 n=1 Tax=Aerococcaceae bacterium zg-1292 TaxID=2774330 RepID=UPI0019355186|nr:CRISPR-associated endonuclease Cas2 [Aerococcaceae bacterium zg-1292]MBS4456715.1 CRISPR-associated endonuclease Cas2 [Aerococcaceae bacterium zg-A91]MBS4458507.1 CRISPR-associated endonuclease Cas2 [Aerococcaceae bacterium zg-BR33]QQA36565.1 CRISPR-associated endonuclease Cas2 [Aerococcaceae bacterium zg-1292]
MRRWFNLSSQDARFARERSVLCVVIYDIISNKRRVQLSKLLEGYGIRIQRSCFEMKLDYNIYQKLLQELEEYYDEEESDNIIVYRADDAQIRRYSMFYPDHNQDYYIEI